MTECGVRVSRGSWYLGPCTLPSGHDGIHDPSLSDSESIQYYGWPTTVVIAGAAPMRVIFKA